MKTYQETLNHIRLNKHHYEDALSWIQSGKLDAMLIVVSYSYNKPLIDVFNDYADLK